MLKENIHIKLADQAIYIIDDNSEVRNALKFHFETVHLTVKTFASAEHFLKTYSVNHKGCLLIDVKLPGMSGIELLEWLNQHDNRIPVIIMTGSGDISMALTAMKAGAKDFVLKPFNEQSLIESVQKYLNASAGFNGQSFSELNERYGALTQREHQVLTLIYEGKLNKQIADELSISVSTVEVHRSTLMDKMQARTTAQLIKLHFFMELEKGRSSRLAP